VPYFGRLTTRYDRLYLYAPESWRTASFFCRTEPTNKKRVMKISKRQKSRRSEERVQSRLVLVEWGSNLGHSMYIHASFLPPVCVGSNARPKGSTAAVGLLGRCQVFPHFRYSQLPLLTLLLFIYCEDAAKSSPMSKKSWPSRWEFLYYQYVPLYLSQPRRSIQGLHLGSGLIPIKNYIPQINNTRRYYTVKCLANSI